MEDGEARPPPEAASEDDRVVTDLKVHRVERIAYIYLVVATIWIIASGGFADVVADRAGLDLGLLEIVKGLAFVLVTAAVLHRSLHRWAGQLQRAAIAEREAAERIRRVEEMRRSFLAGVSHEMRTPLTAIVGYGETINRDWPRMGDVAMATVSSRLVVNAQRLQAMVEDLLEVDRLLQGLGRLHAEKTNVTELARRIVDAAEPVGCRVEVLGDPVVAAVDGAKVERIVQHLLDNAVRHSGGATLITVRVTQDEDRFVTIEVGDDGAGLPEAIIGRLFEPFVQPDDAARRPSPGLGIGLTLVAQVAALHGGTATARNDPGGGARVTVTLAAR